MDPVAVYYHPVFMEHETGEHVENKRRLAVAKQVLEESDLKLEWITPEPAPSPSVAAAATPEIGIPNWVKCAIANAMVSSIAVAVAVAIVSN